MRLKCAKAAKFFEYKKNNNKYRDGTKLYKQIVEKALLITESLYPRYLTCYLFNNVTSHFIYAKNAL